jgi:putative ABC transport system substrate-binding protein
MVAWTLHENLCRIEPRMKRRVLFASMTAAGLLPSRAGAQQKTIMPVIGFLASRGPDEDPQLAVAFRRGLKEAGYVEGQNVAIEYRYADNQYDRLPALAADLVRLQVTVIVANGPASQAAKAATSTIPIVFTAGFDPVEVGLVASLNRPGGNITGITILDVQLGSKRLELLHELVPTGAVFAGLVNPSDPARAQITSSGLQEAAQSLGLQLHVLQAGAERDFDAMFLRLRELGAAGLVIGGEPFFNGHGGQLGALALQHSVPAIFQFRSFAAAGGLASYGASLTAMYRQAATYVSQVLRGAKPANLPVQQPTNFELIINTKTAKSLGVVIPPSILARVDEAIE